jgi:hypothetical protein
MRAVITLQSVKCLQDGIEISDTRLEGFRVRRQGEAVSLQARQWQDQTRHGRASRHVDTRQGQGTR